MSRKAGFILLLILAFTFVIGAENKAYAKDFLNPASISGTLINAYSCPDSLLSSATSAKGASICLKYKTLNVQVDEGGRRILPPFINSNKIFDMVNQYRISRGLLPFEKNDGVCQLAQTRSTELATEIKNGTLHEGLYNRNLPYWIFENAKAGSNEEETVAWWLSSPVHRKAIIGGHKYSCVKCTSNYCSELFTSFSPR